MCREKRVARAGADPERPTRASVCGGGGCEGGALHGVYARVSLRREGVRARARTRAPRIF